MYKCCDYFNVFISSYIISIGIDELKYCYILSLYFQISYNIIKLILVKIQFGGLEVFVVFTSNYTQHVNTTRRPNWILTNFNLIILCEIGKYKDIA